MAIGVQYMPREAKAAYALAIVSGDRPTEPRAMAVSLAENWSLCFKGLTLFLLIATLALSVASLPRTMSAAFAGLTLHPRTATTAIPLNMRICRSS